MITEQADIFIIGAGPASTVAAALLRQQGREVLVIEREEFPRFAVGESLLPQSMHVLEEAGMLRDIVEAGFEHKNGVTFVGRGAEVDFDFRDKTADGWATAYQVPRGEFDDLLADAAERAGAEIRFCHEVVAADFAGCRPRLMVREPDGDSYAVEARFVLDGSGAGRALPRLLGLQSESSTSPLRCALVAQLQDGAIGGGDRHKTRIVRHPVHDDQWCWLVPLSGGRTSLGIVAREALVDAMPGNLTERLHALMAQFPALEGEGFGLQGRIGLMAPRRVPLRSAIPGAWHGAHHALLGNAAEFIDPVFCSGMVIALESARLAASCLRRQAEGDDVDWSADYGAVLGAGIESQRAYADAWQRGVFQSVVFAAPSSRRLPRPGLRRAMSSMLAGYWWDPSNPLSGNPWPRLQGVADGGSDLGREARH